jgi:hypothetical protein
LRTEDGIPDLVLVYSTGVIVVEVKTDTFEHETPSGAPQTVAYAKSVSESLALTDTTPHVVFLTPDGHAPANAAAIASTFGELVVALASELNPEELSPDLRWAFSIVFTHLLTHTAPTDTHCVMAKLMAWRNDRDLLRDDQFVMAQLRTIEQAMQLLMREP